jgi:hypothetical protein
MLYIHYEELKINDKTFLNIVLSSSITQRRIDNADLKSMIQIVDGIFKQVVSTRRSYDEFTKVWSFEGKAIMTMLELFYVGQFSQLGKDKIKKTYFIPHESIEDWVNGLESKDPDDYWAKHRAQTTEVKAEDFFNAPVSTDKRFYGVDVTARLKEICGIKDPKADVTRKDYLMACRKLHPDFGGNTDAFQELNGLWQLFNVK